MISVKVVAKLATTVALACVLASCGSESAETQGAAEETPLASEFTEGDFSEGFPLPDCSNAGDEPCITNGFNPELDGFGFANYGEEGAMGATELIALFGRKNVCARGSASMCVLYPAAEQWAAQINESMAGGRCEGMAVLAARLFSQDNTLEQFDPSAGSVYGLDPSDPDVASGIEMWFATQFLDPVISAYRDSQELTPTEIAAALYDGLAEETGYTLGIYSDTGGHAVTPFGVNFVGDQLAISIYDNNYPGTVQRVMVDPNSETWSYAGGTTEPNAPTNGWAGTTGTIELTPMASRALPAPAPFSERRSKGQVRQTVLVTSPDPQTMAGAVLETGGQSYDLADPKIKLPSGVTVRYVLGNTLTSGSTIVDIDRKMLTDYSITATTENPSATTVPVTMSLDSAGKPRISIQAESPSSAEGVARFSMDDSGVVTADTTDGTPALVSVANGLRGVTFDLDDENSLEIDTDREGIASVILFDEDGDILGSFEVESDTADGSVLLSDVEFDPETGEFEFIEFEAEADEVDTDFLAFVEEAMGDETDEGTDQGTDQGTDEGTDQGTDEGTDQGTDQGPDEGRAEDGPAQDDPVDEGDSGGGDEVPEEE